MLTRNFKTFRTFSTATVTAETKQLDEQKQIKLSNAFKNQHIKYIPTKKFKFNIRTNEGLLAQVYESNPSNILARAQRWKYALGITMPCAIVAS